MGREGGLRGGFGQRRGKDFCGQFVLGREKIPAFYQGPGVADFFLSRSFLISFGLQQVV